MAFSIDATVDAALWPRFLATYVLQTTSEDEVESLTCDTSRLWLCLPPLQQLLLILASAKSIVTFGLTESASAGWNLTLLEPIRLRWNIVTKARLERPVRTFLD